MQKCLLFLLFSQVKGGWIESPPPSSPIRYKGKKNPIKSKVKMPGHIFMIRVNIKFII